MILSLFAGISLYFHAIYKRFQFLVAQIDEESDENELSKGIRIKELLSKIVRFHIVAKE